MEGNWIGVWISEVSLKIISYPKMEGNLIEHRRIKNYFIFKNGGKVNWEGSKENLFHIRKWRESEFALGGVKLPARISYSKLEGKQIIRPGEGQEFIYSKLAALIILYPLIQWTSICLHNKPPCSPIHFWLLCWHCSSLYLSLSRCQLLVVPVLPPDSRLQDIGTIVEYELVGGGTSNPHSHQRRTFCCNQHTPWLDTSNPK